MHGEPSKEYSEIGDTMSIEQSLLIPEIWKKKEQRLIKPEDNYKNITKMTTSITVQLSEEDEIFELVDKFIE